MTVLGTTVPAVGVCAVSAISALFPDIDLCTSKVGYKAKPVSYIVSKLFGHRKLIHSPIFYIAIYFVAMKYVGPYEWVLQAFIAGVASHIFLDMLNRKGIPIFYPISRHYHIATIKTGSKGEIAFRIALALIVLIGIFLLMTKVT